MSQISRNVGRLGEDIACRFIESKGYRVIERNFLKRFGEIDIIATKLGVLSFIEVKAVSRESAEKNEDSDSYDPAEKLDHNKAVRLRRAIESYLLERGGSETPFMTSLIAIVINKGEGSARVRFYEDIIL